MHHLIRLLTEELENFCFTIIIILVDLPICGEHFKPNPNTVDKAIAVNVVDFQYSCCTINSLALPTV